MKRSQKERIASKFWNHPFLYMLARQFLYSGSFRWFLAIFLLAGLAMGLCLPKIWRNTPRGFIPVVKVSLIDKLQARALERTAKQDLAAGKIREGIISYQLAFENTLGDADLLRRVLRAMLPHVESGKSSEYCTSRAFWLLRLGRTNAADLVLTSAIFERLGRFAASAQLLQAAPRPREASVQTSYLKSLFLAGFYGEFAKELAASPPAVRNERQIQLIQAASETIRLGLEGSAPSALKAADEANTPEEAMLSRRLQLHVAMARKDAAAYEAALSKLAEKGQSFAIEHVRLWRLLAQNGLRSRAQELAPGFKGVPAGDEELEALVLTYIDLGLRKDALQSLGEYLATHPWSGKLWAMKADLLEKEGGWQEIREMAVAIRNNGQLAGTLDGFAYYLEGRAELEQQRPASGAESYDKAIQANIRPELVPGMAQGMIDSRHAKKALQLLDRTESNAVPVQVVRALKLQIAEQERDAELLLAVAKALHAESPSDPTAASNLAAALLIRREDPTKALMLTLQLVQRSPDFLPYRLNHAMALILNHRATEGLALLANIDLDKLSGPERSTYAFVRAEAHQALGDRTNTTRFAAMVSPGELYPLQLDRLKLLRGF